MPNSDSRPNAAVQRRPIRDKDERISIASRGAAAIDLHALLLGLGAREKTPP